MNKNLILHPKVEDLRRECEELRESLADLVEKREHLANVHLPAARHGYNLRFGPKILRICELRFLNEKCRARLARLQRAFNRGETIDAAAVEKEIEELSARWRSEVVSAARKIDGAKRYEEMPKLSVEESREHQQLFREIARATHPDVSPMRDDSPNLFMTAREAYRNGDLSTLRAIALMLRDGRGLKQEDGESSVSELERVKSRLKDSVAAMLSDIEKLYSSPDFASGAIVEDETRAEDEDGRLCSLVADQESNLARCRDSIAPLLEHFQYAYDPSSDSGDVFDDDILT